MGPWGGGHLGIFVCVGGPGGGGDNFYFLCVCGPFRNGPFEIPWGWDILGSFWKQLLFPKCCSPTITRVYDSQIKSYLTYSGSLKLLLYDHGINSLLERYGGVARTEVIRSYKSQEQYRLNYSGVRVNTPTLPLIMYTTTWQIHRYPSSPVYYFFRETFYIPSQIRKKFP